MQRTNKNGHFSPMCSKRKYKLTHEQRAGHAATRVVDPIDCIAIDHPTVAILLRAMRKSEEPHAHSRVTRAGLVERTPKLTPVQLEEAIAVCVREHLVEVERDQLGRVIYHLPPLIRPEALADKKPAVQRWMADIRRPPPTTLAQIRTQLSRKKAKKPT